MSKSLALLLLLSLPVGVCQAQMYKWVDAQGHVHFTDNKEEAGRARVEQMKGPDAAPQPGGADWKLREEEYKLRHKQQPQAAAQRPRQMPESYYSDKQDVETSRCRLARDVLNGAARHMNGNPTDAYDREVAANDVKNFCH